jgi:hypothetical protein
VPEQLATARALQAEHGLDFPLIEGSAEAVPLPDNSFDVAISELLCMHDEDEPSGETLALPQFGMRRFECSDGSVEFHLPHGELIALLARSGFTVEALHELQAPEGTTTRFTYVTAEWARRWPSEEIWVARLREERASAVA